VRSTAQLDYPGVQRAFDTNTLPDPVAALPEVGRARLAVARRRHAIDLDLPEQLVERDVSGAWTLRARVPLEVEQWNAEISLLTGEVAARLMLDGGVGVLRTVPPAPAEAIAALRRAAAALDVPWPDGAAPGDVLAMIDRSDPKHVAFVDHAASLLRGSGYAAFDGAPPAQPLHSGIGVPYAHVTAPLRRLVDRYGATVCVALHAGQPVPQWARSALPGLPETMSRADRLAHEVDRAVVDATEAWLLQDRVGETFSAIVIDASAGSGTVVLDEPAVRARCDCAGLETGSRIDVRLVTADVVRRDVRFQVASPNH
jgi:exoribonuclease R